MDAGNQSIKHSSGYSGTPLAKKLGIKNGFKIKLVNAPDNYFDLFTDLPIDIYFEDDDAKKDLIHFFTIAQDEYVRMLPQLREQLKSDGMIWASWPKKVSKMATDITETIIRDYAIEIGLVDVKVCAIDETWSGLKLVIPVKNR